MGRKIKVAVVIGVTGQDGSLLSRSLIEQGHKVVGVSRSDRPNVRNLAELGIVEKVELASAEITDFRALLELIETHQPVEIYNLAAQSSVGLSYKQPVKTCESIVNGTVNLLEVARFLSYSGRIFFASSSEIFGNTEFGATRDTKTDPVSPYAVAKDAGMKFVRVYRESYGIQAISGILFNHESPFRSPSFVTKKIVDGAVRCSKDEGFKLKLGNLGVSRDWGWAEEYVEAMQLLTRADRLSEEVVCTGREATLQYFVERVFTAVGLNWQEHVVIDENLARPSDIRRSVGDPNGMKDRFNWAARFRVEQVVDKLVDYSLSNWNDSKLA